MNAKHDLAEALCQLLETKTLEKITVKDIVARCGVNRQTFYYHFHDVYDLMRWIFDREAAALAQSIRSNGSDWRQELRTITDVLRSKRHLVMNAYRSVNRRDLERYLMQGYGPVDPPHRGSGGCGPGRDPGGPGVRVPVLCPGPAERRVRLDRIRHAGEHRRRSAPVHPAAGWQPAHRPEKRQREISAKPPASAGGFAQLAKSPKIRPAAPCQVIRRLL